MVHDPLNWKSLSRRGFAILTLVLALLAFPGLSAAQDSTGSLKILVYGASGKVGTHIVDEALQRGHHVTAVSRDPAKISRTDPNLAVVKGNILDNESVASLVAGQDVIIISVRGVLGKSKDPADSVARIGVEKVVDALRAEGGNAARLIHVGGSGSLEVAPGKLYADTLPKIFIPRELQTEIAGQIAALNYLRTITDVNWSYATPARNFTNGKRTGVFRIGGDQMLEDARGRSRISRADFAVALINEAEKPEHPRQRFSVAY
ncbi:MAG: NAD(P)H-binding protein [Lysobacterales bacterium]